MQAQTLRVTLSILHNTTICSRQILFEFRTPFNYRIPVKIKKFCIQRIFSLQILQSIFENARCAFISKSNLCCKKCNNSRKVYIFCNTKPTFIPFSSKLNHFQFRHKCREKKISFPNDASHQIKRTENHDSYIFN